MPDAGCKIPVAMQGGVSRWATQLNFWIIIHVEYKKMQNNTGLFHDHGDAD